MKKRLIVCFIGLLSLFSFSAFIVDEDPFAELLKKLEEFTKKLPQEKIYLHLDKPYYAIGDDIWFKAYVIDSKTSQPTTISNILYVELINDRDSITKQIKLPMQSGITWGDFKLSDSLREGNYRIRAYTQWMRNAGPAFFFDKTIKIGNGWTNKVFTKTDYQYSTENNEERLKTTIQFVSASATPFSNAEVIYQIVLGSKKTSIAKTVTNANGEININIINTAANSFKSGKIIATITLPDGSKVVKSIPIKSTSSSVDVQFFPEGGNLIEGLPCKVAIKATNSNGLGENVSGAVIDNEGVEVLTFETNYLGMSSFSLNPMSGKTYTAKIKFVNGKENNFTLPKAETSGYVLSVNNLDSAKMSIKVMLTPDLLNKGELNLVAQHNGNVLFSGKVPTAKQIASVVVPKINFPSGIVQITLFNPQNMPVSERLTFVNNVNDKINLDFENLKPTYSKKAVVDLSITATNNEKPVQGSFSVAITNTNVVDPDPENESNILTSLLLTSDLVGYVEKPNHYFLKNDITTKIELDQLLLTQGWRKINWDTISSSQLPTINYPAEKNMKISGLVTNNGKPVVKGKVSLLSSSKGIFATDTETDANGRFIFDQIAFNDSTKFAIKAVTNTDHKGVKIIMDDIPAQLITINKNTADVEINVNNAIKDYLKQSAAYFNEQESKGFLTRVNQLKAVEIVAKANKAAPSSSNLNGPGMADAVFSADELKNSTSLSHFLSGRLVGMRVENGYVRSTRTDGVTTVIVDGVTYIDGQGGDALAATPVSLDDLNILDIESIEILKNVANTTIYGHAGQNGVIVITTKTGKGRTTFNTRAPGMLTYTPKGFYSVRQFYSPKYDVKQDDKPDFRPTVYWNPNLVSDANGKAKLNYFNTDQLGNYRIVIEGIDADGNLARKVYTYEVK
ncbi:MAG: TonB-dependent receptor [Pedobacter sp.]|jgi:TonB-dependent SusC/RagA subfamily outer membrane receptor|uniref:TonB-dependent receptor n=1 Tax=Pedobacter sp. TaxID=1411316 RepID=UPI0035618A4F